MRSLLLPALCLLALASCGQYYGDYPALAQTMLKRELPADGNAHIQRRGTFSVTPDTVFCTFSQLPGWRGIDPVAIDQTLASLGQSDQRDGTKRNNGIFGERPTPECREGGTGDRIYIRGDERVNSAGTWYKQTLVVWQRDAIWVGVVERPGGLRPDADGSDVPVNDGPSLITMDELREEARRRNSRERDWAALGRTFLAREVLSQRNSNAKNP